MLRYASALLLLAAVAGCMDSAPHDNPFDPASENFDDEGAIMGSVRGIYPSTPGREGVRIRVMPLDGQGTERVATTDAMGSFTITRVPTVPTSEYVVVAEGDGLRTETDTITVQAGLTARADFGLDALPEILTQNARTVHIERWVAPTTLFQLEVEAIVTDSDRATDVNGVELVVDDIGFRAALTQVAPGHYEGKFDAEMLPGGQVQAFLGRPLRVEVTDVNGNVGTGAPMTLVRVVEQTPLTASPQGTETITDPSPSLVWRPAQIPFPFTYRVDLYHVDGAGIPRLIESESGIDSSVTSYDVERVLGEGNYYWTVWLVDGAGNRSRSKEAGFSVGP